MRIAWFTPLPPTRSGISAYSADLLPCLADRHDIEAYVDDRPAEPGGAPPTWETPVGVTARSAHDFVWRHADAAYDLVVYQLGNATCHDYMWPYLHRYPGLVVLHDGQLHHSRARRLLQQGRADHYRAEFVFDHPSVKPEVAEFAVAGFSGAPYYFWPMLGTALRRARTVAVHNPRLAKELGASYPEVPLEPIVMGVPEPVDSSGHRPPAAGAKEAVARRHAIPGDAVLLVAFGLVTPEKRLTVAIATLRALSDSLPQIHLLLVGQTVSHFDIHKEAQDAGVANRVIITGFADEDAVSEYLAAADVCLCLRWPTTRATSASWLRCLAAGKPTIVTDLADMIDVPTLDPRGWAVQHASTLPPDTEPTPAPVAVSVDILDEAHSLRLAITRLVRDPALRATLGRDARTYWRRHHTLDRMVEDYERLLPKAARCPMPAPDDLPPHLLADGTTLARRVLAECGVADDFL